MRIAVSDPCSLMELRTGAFPEASRTTLKQMISHGNITINGKMNTHPAFRLNPGDEVVYTRQVVYKNVLKPPHPVWYEDTDLLIAEKPAGLLTIGDKGQGGTSFYREMLDWIRENTEGRERLYVVHRLDREVSGLLILAKSEKIQQQLKENWKQARKLYYALVEGEPPDNQGVIKSWLHEGKDQKVYSGRESETAKFAITRYRLLDKTPGFSLLEIELETGRKNQIRVHLSDLGCPVVGDRRYGADDRYIRRIRLHAFYLSLPHPVTGQMLEVKSKMPRDFLRLRAGDESYK